MFLARREWNYQETLWVVQFYSQYFLNGCNCNCFPNEIQIMLTYHAGLMGICISKVVSQGIPVTANSHHSCWNERQMHLQSADLQLYLWYLAICVGLLNLKSCSSKALSTWKTSHHDVIIRPNLLACTGTQARRLSSTRIITLSDVVYFDFLSHHLFCWDQTVIYILAPVIVDHKPRVKFLVMLTQSSLGLLELFFSSSLPSEPNHIPRHPPFFHERSAYVSMGFMYMCLLQRWQTWAGSQC